MSLYTQDGVDIEAGDDFSAFANKVARETWKHSRFVHIHDLSKGHFRGPMMLLPSDTMPKGCGFDFAPDGVGTKVTLITEALSHRQAARDVLAMTAGDITRYGGLPVAFSNVLDVRKLGDPGTPSRQAFEQLILGLADAALEQGIVLYRGETAELGDCVSSENPEAVTHFNWAGFAIGLHHPDKVITGERLKPGQPIVAIRENGFRSNGMSTVRKALRMKFGEEYNGKWWENPKARNSIRAAAAPSVLPDRFLAEVNGWYDPEFVAQIRIVAIAHITGGGILGKFGNDILFPMGLSADLPNLYEPPPVMLDCVEWRGFTDSEEIYKTLGCGQCVLVVLENNRDAKLFVELAKHQGLDAQPAGNIEDNDETGPALRIDSKFDGKEFTYRPK